MFLFEKNNEICGKSPKKICRNGLCHVLSITKNASLSKKSEKNNDYNLEEMPKKLVFLAFLAGKKYLSKIGLGHIFLDITFLH